MDATLRRFLLALAVVLTPLGAAAQTLTLEQANQIQTHVKASIAEFRVYLTCSATFDEKTREFMQSLWRKRVSETIDQLVQAGYPGAQLSLIRAQTLVENVMLPGNTIWSDVILFCAEYPKWSRQMSQLEFTDLPAAVREVIQAN